MKKQIIFGWLLFLFCGISHSQTIAKFNHIWVDKGLPSRTVWSILQDKDGFLWFATSNGVVKYNGYDFKLINPPNTDNYMSGIEARALVEDQSGGIWIGTKRKGLIYYNKQHNSLKLFKHQPNNPNSIVSNDIQSLASDEQFNLWIGTNKGLNKLNIKNGEITHFHTQQNNLNSILSNRIKSLLLSKNILWIGTDKGLVRLNPKTQKILRVEVSDAQPRLVFNIFETSNQEILIGTIDGLFKFDRKQKTLVNYHPSLSDKVIISIKEDKENNLWVGVLRDGIYKLFNESIVNHYQYDKGNPYSIGDNSVLSLLIDDSDTLWVGTFNAGIDWLDLKSLQFEFYDDSKESLTCLNTPVVYTILKHSNEQLWVGTEKGLARVDLDSGYCRLYKNQVGNNSSLVSNEVLSLFEDNNKNIWVGTVRGTNILPNGKNDFQAAHKSLPKIPAYDYLEDSNKNLYIATSQGLFFRVNGTQKFKPIKSHDKTLENIYVSQVEHDSNGQVWLATDKGLLTVDQSLNIKRPDFNIIYDIGAPLKALFIDKNNRFWLGLENIGLVILDESGSLVKIYNDASTMKATQGFSSIAESTSGDIWISSINGLEKVNPETWQVTSFNEADGLQSQVFTRGAVFVDNKKNIFLGGRKGLTRFNPDNISTNIIKPRVSLTEFLYFNEVLEHGSTGKNFSLDSSISQIKTLELGHNNYEFGFEFSALHYADPSRNEYAFKMENWDDDWNFTTAKHRRAAYNNLPAGDYIFKVKASNNHGLWNEKPLELNVRITPPPWKTVWAYALYFVFSILLILYVVRYRTRSLQARAVILEKSIAQRTQELTTEKQKVEKLLSRKNEEFANVSHEFRTPLTLILGPTEQLLKNHLKDPYKKLQIIQRNAYRLLRMVDQLLNMESFRVKSITQKSVVPSHQTIRLIAEAFKDLAKEKNITLTITHLEPINLEMVPDALEKIVLNLLSNAVKYTPEGGGITVNSFRTDSNQLHVQVTDTGIGIPENNQSRIFDRFQRILNQHSEQITGAGIGLALVKSLVENHQGSIELNSQPNLGTEFNIFIPIKGELSGNFDVHTNSELVAVELMSISSQHPTHTTPEQEAMADGSNKPHLLLVEDNLDMQNYILECLTEFYRISVASNGKQGLELAEAEVPDLIISDIMMPEMDGYQFTQAIRSHDMTNHIPLILLTARSDRESKLKGWEEKADEYLTKPFDVDELLIRINNLLEIRELLRSRFAQTLFGKPFDSPIKTILTPKPTTKKSVQEQKQQQFLASLDQVLKKCYGNQDVAMKQIAKDVAMSERQLYRKLQAIVNMSLSEYLKRFRLEKACQFLSEGKAASFVSLEVGFSSHSYFGKCFKAQYGCTPSEYLG